MTILHICWVQYSLVLYKSLQSSMLRMSKSEVFVYKREKYSYFWSFSEYGEENKKFLQALVYLAPKWSVLKQNEKISLFCADRLAISFRVGQFCLVFERYLVVLGCSYCQPLSQSPNDLGLPYFQNLQPPARLIAHDLKA